MAKLYNTLSKKVEEFIPIEKGKIRLYTCGPTVYHFAHIGNLRNVIFNDSLRRMLEANGYLVNHVMNITDVGHLVSDADEGEDKLEKGAKREGKSVWDVAQFYADAFIKHTRALNVLSPTKTIKATNAIPSQIDLVKTLLDKGFAYQAEQAIYFDISKLDDYGKLSGQKLKDKEIGARQEVVTDSSKRNPQDFALWFFTTGHFKNHEMHWQSPWGKGFPGWHLECSAIIHQTLGEPIDIHTGGVDHIGTHHTNEIAQSEAAFGKSLARFWLHNEFLNQAGAKMAKSGQAAITLDDVTRREYPPMALRLFYLQSHYRSQANFTWQNLEAANNRLNSYQAFADLRFQVFGNIRSRTAGLDFNQSSRLILEAMSNDLGSPKALAIIDSLIDQTSNLVPNNQAKNFKALLNLVDGLLGLDLLGTVDINSAQKKLIESRQAARFAGDWTKADQLRQELKQQGVGLIDIEHGPIWYRAPQTML